MPEPPPGGLTPWIEIYKYQRRYTVHRFCAKQMKAFSGLRENVTMVIAIYNLSCQGHKKYILIFFINLPQKKGFVLWTPLVKQSVWSAHGRFWLVVFVEVRARRFLGNEARFLVDTFQFLHFYYSASTAFCVWSKRNIFDLTSRADHDLTEGRTTQQTGK